MNPARAIPEIRGTRILAENLNATTRVVANEGGSRSSKTYSIIQYLIILALKGCRYKITISRSRLTWLRATAMRDFFDILISMGLYNDGYHNRTENTYWLNGTEFCFIGLDEDQKIRGRKQDIFWLNEANEARKADFDQVKLRTVKQIILDYNPSDEFHWIYDCVLTRPDCTLIKSTYRDNAFLEKELVQEIEALESTDHDLWRIFGLGLRGVNRATVYNHYKIVDTIPEVSSYCYGLDFGFNHPTVLMWIGFHEKTVYWKELVYQTGLTTADLLALMKDMGISKVKEIYADSAAADQIEEIYRAGYNIHPAKKDVNDGILAIKTLHLCIHRDSVNTIKEVRNYKWKVDKNGKVLDEPVKFMDDAMDAGRYGTYSKMRAPQLTMAKVHFTRRK